MGGGFGCNGEVTARSPSRSVMAKKGVQLNFNTSVREAGGKEEAGASI